MQAGDPERGAASAHEESRRSETIGLLRRFGRRHRKVAGIGFLGTLGVVLTRIALPWPLRGVIEVAFPGHTGHAFLGDLLPAGVDPVLLFCLAYLVLASACGFAEFVQRVWLTRFVSQTVHDLRAAALEAMQSSARAHTPADLIARTVGDSARLKANLKAFLIHISQNGLLIVGITALFLYLAPKLGLLLLLSSLLALWLGRLAIDDVSESSLEQRETESRYAQRVHHRALAEAEQARDGALNRKSAHKQVRTARLINRATLLIHVAVACTLSLAMYLGVRDVRSGILAPGELFLFIAYALTMHRRSVRVGREVARAGKILANAERLASLIGEGRSTMQEGLRPPEHGILLEAVCLKSSSSHRGRHRLGPVDLEVARGTHLAVLGSAGDGKSSLLRVLAGMTAPSSGRLLWDGEDLTDSPQRLRSAVSYLPQEPHLERTSLRSCLGIEAKSEAATPALDEDLLHRLGVQRLLRHLRRGLDTIVDGVRLAPSEQRALMLARIVLGKAPVWILDTPLASRRDRKHLCAVLDRAGDRTLVAALAVPCLMDRFSQVVVLRRGRIAFLGTPSEWKTWKQRTKQLKA